MTLAGRRRMFSEVFPKRLLLNIVPGEPVQHSMQDVFLMRELFDWVAFVGVDDHLGFDAN